MEGLAGSSSGGPALAVEGVAGSRSGGPAVAVEEEAGSSSWPARAGRPTGSKTSWLTQVHTMPPSSLRRLLAGSHKVRDCGLAPPLTPKAVCHQVRDCVRACVPLPPTS